ncbi:hypothetical protein GEV33_007590 [Tenebrio molitor]|uniref:G-protein coupled receptors family 1 profile domain-containing protein n=1 Tax=Tenebrio molitor TaxID=7067 RepID=A0A8J6HIY2_TENMO|nr:hypothetical protein GEV33_007590 [Tenebrio molitor]
MAANITQDLGFNVTNETASYQESGYNQAESIVITIILVVIIIGTIVGNILVCVAVCLVRKLRRPSNYLLVSLAVSDLCVAILVMPMAMFYEIKGRWIFGEIVCNLWVSFDVLSCTASILNLCMISVDRYYAITKPLEYGVKRTPKRMIIWVILVWCFAACISLPPLLIIGNEHSEREESGHINNEVCLVSQDFGYQLYATLCSFYIPLTVMMVVYYKIFRAARKIVLEEKRAQSHLESHCYLEISVKNGGGPPENKISSQSPSPANPSRVNHRSSSASTNTMVSYKYAPAQKISPSTFLQTIPVEIKSHEIIKASRQQGKVFGVELCLHLWNCGGIPCSLLFLFADVVLRYIPVRLKMRSISHQGDPFECQIKPKKNQVT